MNKADIVDVLEDIAVLLELKGDNPFKIRAYSGGARVLETMEENLADVIEEGRLGAIKGIGSALVDKIKTLHATGELEYYTKLRESIAPGLIEMLEIPGLGGKKVKKLHEALGVESIDALKKACENDEVAALKGFGAKSQEKILTGIANRAAYAKRHLWWNARAVAEPILEELRALPQVERAEAAGSLRRLKETVGDLDFIVASSDPEPIMDWFVAQEDVQEVSAHGATKSSVRFGTGLQADLRVVPAEQFAFALHHFTGSKEHNVAMRQRALAQGYSLSEWGLKPGGLESEQLEVGSGELIVSSEKELFEFLGLQEIPPELREGTGGSGAWTWWPRQRARLLPGQAAVPPKEETPQITGGVSQPHDGIGRAGDDVEEMAEAAAGAGL
jgi:DNA polymerase (family 10)